MESLELLIKNRLINLNHLKIKEHPAALGLNYTNTLTEKITKLKKIKKILKIINIKMF